MLICDISDTWGDFFFSPLPPLLIGQSHPLHGCLGKPRVSAVDRGVHHTHDNRPFLLLSCFYFSFSVPSLVSPNSPGAISPLSAAAAAAAAAGRVALAGHSGTSGVLLVSNLNEEVSMLFTLCQSTFTSVMFTHKNTHTHTYACMRREEEKLSPK